jgi:ABC-2 type transport system permease protein
MDPGSLIIILGLPALYLVIFGTMFPSIVTEFTVNGVEFTYMSFLASGIVSFQTVMAGTVGGSMLWGDLRFGMFSQILSGPFTRTQYLFGIIMTTTAASLIGAFIMLAIAAPLGASLVITPIGILLVLLNLIFGGVFFCSLMLYISAKVKSNQAYSSFQILIIFAVNFITDVFYPINSRTPLALRWISWANPLTYVTDGIRAGLSGPSHIFAILNPIETVVLVVETVLMFLLAYKSYASVNTSMS